MNHHDLYVSIGQNLAARRRQLVKTQAEIARRAGMSRPSLANVESGRQSLTLHQYYQLAAALDLKDARDLLPAKAPLLSDEPPATEIMIKSSRELPRNQSEQVQRAIAAHARKSS